MCYDLEKKRFMEKSLFEREFEKDNCGMGFIANIDGLKTNKTIKDGIRILMGLEHRGASGYDSETGDGAGLLFEIPDAFFRDICENLPKMGELSSRHFREKLKFRLNFLIFHKFCELGIPENPGFFQIFPENSGFSKFFWIFPEFSGKNSPKNPGFPLGKALFLVSNLHI